MSQITTHILDISKGQPAKGVNVVLESQNENGWQIVSRGVTNDDGRVLNLLAADRIIPPGIYRLIFDTRSYYFANGQKGFYPSVTIDFEITDKSHYHVPLLLSPFGYSTYRGS
jgi:hydroxyisourate hydrolase